MHTRAVPMDEPVQAIYIGNLRLEPTKPCTRWKDFWITQRIAPLLELTDAQLGSRRRGLERLLQIYEPPIEGPCVLHGDLGMATSSTAARCLSSTRVSGSVSAGRPR